MSDQELVVKIAMIIAICGTALLLLTFGEPSIVEAMAVRIGGAW